MPRQQRPPITQLPLQKVDTRFFIPVGITPQAQVVGDFAECGGMACGVLADVQAHQEQAEGHGPAQAVE
ncbi:hypothetical protein D3C76_1355530 [compost metagenome]